MLLKSPSHVFCCFSYGTRSIGQLVVCISILGLALLPTSRSFSQETRELELKQKGSSTTAKDKEGWVSLIPEKELEGWQITDFYGHGEVKRTGDVLAFTPGKPLTGITYKKEFPKEHFEIEMEARRVKGNDFLCGLTFPVGKGFCSLIGGGWGGGLVGLSSVDGSDASENSNSTHIDFKNGQWYKFRVVVDKEFVRAWVDDKEILAQEREGHEFSTRIEVFASQPLGQCVFQSDVEVKNFRWRPLDPETGKPLVK